MPSRHSLTNALGLRGKLLLALLLTFLLAVGLATAVGVQALADLRAYFGESYARNFTALSKQRILAPVARELALSQQLAESVVTREFLANENSIEHRQRFFAEARGYQATFADHSYFLISARSRHYYFNDNRSPESNQPRYVVDPSLPENAWFVSTLLRAAPYNINIDYDSALRLTKVWINVTTREAGEVIAVAGTGLDFTRFLEDFTRSAEPGVTPMIIDGAGFIQAHPDASLIAFRSGAGVATDPGKTLFELLDTAGKASAKAALETATSTPESIALFRARLDGREQLFALSYLPELKWHVVTAVNLGAAEVIDPALLLPVALAALLAVVILVLGATLGVNRLVVEPLLRLTHSARAMAAGRYEVSLPEVRNDEIGALTTAFAQMSAKVRRHTEELEGTVRARTEQLLLANTELQASTQKIRSSIDYASLIQKAMLPDAALAADWPDQHAVLWQPRDVVGGDFYCYRRLQGGVIFGVVDCAGHGVPGAFMTMLAWSALDTALSGEHASDPAEVLRRMDAALRAMAPHTAEQLTVSTHMDAALLWVDNARQQARFAGARMSLFVESAGLVNEYKGGRRALADRQPGQYVTTEIALTPGSSLYLSSDGFLDQAGGEQGFGFGTSRFRELLAEQRGTPMAARAAAFDEALSRYRGSQAQRDDVTIFGLLIQA